MNALHLVGGEKGGVGKSFTARLLAQYLIDNQQAMIAFDSDASHSTFSRFYKDYANSVDVEAFDSLDAIIDAAESHNDTHILVDLAAQTSRHVLKWMEESNVGAIMAELDTRIIYWHVMDDGADAMFLLDKLQGDLAKHNAECFIVKNYGRGKSFQALEHSDIYQNIRQSGGQIISLPKLQESLAQKIDFNSLSFWAASNNASQMKIAERNRVKVWLTFSYEQLDQALQGNLQLDTTTPSPLYQAREPLTVVQ